MRSICIAVLLVAGFGVAYWLISPLFITKRVDESMSQIATTQETMPETLRQGTFVGLAGHNAQGTAKLLQSDGIYYVRLEDDFQVTNGPDLFVHFGKDGTYVASARLEALKGNAGGQNYEIPPGLNPDDYNEVWIWCRAFSVPFAKAVLR